MALDIDIDRNSPVPLWHQISEAIGEQIRNGHLAGGERLENEKDLAARLGLSRPTVRHAMEALVRQGIVVRKQGIGTQVVQPRPGRDPGEMSLFDDLVRNGQQPTTKLLEWTIGTVEQLGGRLMPERLDPAEPAVRISRLRLADGVPLAILTNYMPERLALTPEKVIESGLYASLRTIGIQPKVAHLTIGARELGAREAKLLGEPKRATGLTSERLVFDGSGNFVEYGRHIYRASLYTIELNLVG